MHLEAIFAREATRTPKKEAQERTTIPRDRLNKSLSVAASPASSLPRRRAATPERPQRGKSFLHCRCGSHTK